MSVWLCIPSKRSPDEVEPVLKQWRERGYEIAIVVDSDGDAKAKDGLADTIISPKDGYPGYAHSCNALIELVVGSISEAEWFVTGGDDVLPDPNHSAEEIAAQCAQYFRVAHSLGGVPWPRVYGSVLQPKQLETFGVMQPTGDRDFGDAQGPYIDRVCGSPWLGREFCKRMYGGTGPYFPGYRHMGVDEELQAVAQKLGVLWQRPDLIHFHQHWGRPRAGETMGQADRMPEFLKEANSPQHWREYKKLFAERQAAGFPGHEPI